MFLNTLEYLVCPACASANDQSLSLSVTKKIKDDIRWGAIHCQECSAEYPIWDGVLIWVADVIGYVSAHAAGITEHIPAEKVSAQYRDLLSELEMEEIHIDESLESARVTSLYWLGHYVSGKDLIRSQKKLPSSIQKMISQYWDHGPMQRLKSLLEKNKIKGSLLELGCGSGGLIYQLGSQTTEYLGVDSSFQGIYRAREILTQGLNSYPAPGELVQGPLSTQPKSTLSKKLPERCDFIVMDIENVSFKKKNWDMIAAFNVIDMLSDPVQLFKIQKSLLGKKGIAIQSSPYIWHPSTAKKLKAKPNESSADCILRLAKNEGFKRTVFDEKEVPWLFFKNRNQIELYNVHLMGVSQ